MKMKNEIAINYLTNQLTESRNAFAIKQQKYHDALPVIFAASNWAEWDIAIQALEGSTEQPCYYTSKVLSAWQDAEGFDFMKPRVLKRLFEDYDASCKMQTLWEAGRHNQISRLKLEQLS